MCESCVLLWKIALSKPLPTTRNLVSYTVAGFRNRYRFSRNQRVGRAVPQYWRSGECIILMSCENDYDADVFSYVDVLRAAKKIVDQVSGFQP